MSKSGQVQVILLLADGFDEAAVSLILTSLRQAGLAVSLVGLRANRVCGAHGMVIVPNISLDRLLEQSRPISALILPSGTAHLARLRVDPRVSRLLQRSLRQEAMLVSLGEQVSKLIIELAETTEYTINIVEPEADIYLEDFAAGLAQQLVGIVEG